MADNNPIATPEHKIGSEYTGKKVRIGIVGAGNISETHLHSYKEVPQVEVVAICDIDENRVKMTADSFGIEKRYLSIEEMIAAEELDAVDVCVWNCNHAKCAIYALEHGLNVICEKPMATTVAECEAMKAAAEKSGKVLMMAFVRVFTNETDIVEEYKEELGDIYYAKMSVCRRHGAPGGWFCDSARSGGGPVIDLAVHALSQIYFNLGRVKPVSVYAMTNKAIGNRPNLKNKVTYTPYPSKFDNGVIDTEDFGVALVRFENGAVIEVEASYDMHMEPEGSFDIYGTKGGIRMADGKNPVLYTDIKDRMVNMEIVRPAQVRKPFVEELTHFADCVLNGTPCKTTADDGINITKILTAIYESAKTKHEVIL